jgi:uncharacterized protein (TIGR00730 family)
MRVVVRRSDPNDFVREHQGEVFVSSDSPPSENRLTTDDFDDDQLKYRHTEDLVQTIRDYAEKLLHDGTTRGDLKILSRTLRELRYAFKVFSPYRGRRKVTVFGSARTLPDAPAYKQAMEFGREMAARKWMVITGAASGIMEAGHRGAGRDHAMGLNIMLPFEQSANEIIAGDAKLVHMKYFFTRKLMFVKECDAVVCLPGGFGTLDEALEVLTLLQTGKHDLMPVVFLDAPGGIFWQSLHNFFHDHLLSGQMISAEDKHLYRVTDSIDEAIHELTHFYRVYHSMRYVKHRLVFRMNQPLSDAHLEEINTTFAEILSEGKFVQSGALSGEQDEPQLAPLSRLIFRFNRRNLGRLRQLINFINDTAGMSKSA